MIFNYNLFLAPSSPPVDIQVEMGERPGELLVSWLPPPQHTFNGILLGYIITAVPQINEDSGKYIKKYQFRE